MIEFKPKSSDVSFPWKVFWATLALYLVTIFLWALSAGQPTKIYVIGCIISLLVAILLGKFIQKLKFFGTLSPVKVSNEGIYIETGVGLGVLYTPWNKISKIETSKVKLNRKKYYNCIDVKVLYPFVLADSASSLQKGIWKIICTVGGGRKFRIWDGNLAEDIDVLIDAISSYFDVTKANNSNQRVDLTR